MPQTHRVMWAASLSNGEDAHENKGKFLHVDGERSPWGKLVAYMKETGTRVTSLRLVVADGRTFNLPSSGKRAPKFDNFHGAAKPHTLRCYRAYGQDSVYDVEAGTTTPIPGTQDLYTIIEAEYFTHKTQLWVSEENTRDCHVLTELQPECQKVFEQAYGPIPMDPHHG